MTFRPAISALLFLAAGLCCCDNGAVAGEFNNWPTYASAPLQNWPKASEYDQLIDDFHRIHKGLVQRCIVTSVSIVTPPATGGTRWPWEDLMNFKYKAMEMSNIGPSYPGSIQPRRFVDYTKEESFSDYQYFPRFTYATVLACADVNLQSDYFFTDQNPHRCLQDIVPPGWTAGYGVPGMKKVLKALKWTGENHIPGERINLYEDIGRLNLTSLLVMHGSHMFGIDWADDVQLAQEQFESRGWHEVGSHDACSSVGYYSLSYGGAKFPDIERYTCGAERTRSTAVLKDIHVPDGVIYDWQAWVIAGAHNGPFWDGDGFGLAELKLTKWAESTDKADAEVTCPRIIGAQVGGAVSSSFPAPLFGSAPPPSKAGGVTIGEIDWLLKWHFTDLELW